MVPDSPSRLTDTDTIRVGPTPTVESTATAIGEARLTPHGLRHTTAFLAKAAGGNVRVVQQMFGHATASMTLDLDGRLFPDQLDDVADRLDAIGRAAADNPADYLRTMTSCGPSATEDRRALALTAVAYVGPAGLEPTTTAGTLLLSTTRAVPGSRR